MNSHKTKEEKVGKNEPICIETDHKDVRILRSRIQPTPELSIQDDDDIGGDPYNSTGQHVIIELKNQPEE
ncbi:MAG: hypothetical protein GTO41_23625 [Burkholderiales bacterium]|nr:hypothetical protein [Burkholderiales bacterium]